MNQRTIPKSVNWSSMPTDALLEISTRLTFDLDYVRFRSVCTSWRAAAPKRPHRLWFIAHRKGYEGNSTLLLFHRFNGGDGGEISPIPELLESPLSGRMRCCGSSLGWLALLDLGVLSIVLWNPITRSKIQLPRFPARARDFRSRLPGNGEFSLSTTRFILSADPALFPDDYVAYFDSGYAGVVALYRAGKPLWTPMKLPSAVSFDTVAFYEGRLMWADDGNVYICDVTGERKVKKIESVMKYHGWNYDNIDESHLVVSGGDLLLVLIHWASTAPDCRFLFSVFKVDLAAAKARLVMLDSLGDRALFLSVGQNHSFSVVASRVPGCRGNTIYYTEIRYDREPGMVSKFTACNVKDNSTVFIPICATHLPLDWEPYAWFTPSFLPLNCGTNN